VREDGVREGAKEGAKSAGARAGAWRGLILWALLGVVAVAVVAIVGRPSRAPSELPPAPPAQAGSPSGSPTTRGTASAAEGGPGDMTPAERRDFHVMLGHEQCEEGMRKFNALEGREPTDPAVITRLSVCLRIGNLAWYKCMLRAAGSEDAHVCNRRFLSLDNPP
jgi:hypothetical protein